MVILYLSYTSKINKEGDAPVLTIDQVWKGLQRKIRFAQEFVPIIESCTVLEEKEDGTVIRDVKFKDGAGPKPRARETVREYYPSWVSSTISFLRLCCIVCIINLVAFLGSVTGLIVVMARGCCMRLECETDSINRLISSKKTEHTFVTSCLMVRLARNQTCT